MPFPRFEMKKVDRQAGRRGVRVGEGECEHVSSKMCLE